MSNLYHSIEALKSFLENNKQLTEAQRLFIEEILQGNESRAGFEDIILNRKKDQRELLKVALSEEISNTSGSNSYIRLLKDLLKNIQATENKEDQLAKLQAEIPKGYKKYITALDTLYLKTSKQFHGTLMLPVTQGADSRLADSNGECFGYIAEWARKIQLGQNPFGVPVDSDPPFKPIKFDSALWRQFPDLNHLAPLKADISIYQSLQANTFDLASKLSGLPGQSKQAIHYDKLKKQKFYSSISQIAEELVQYADKDPQKTINLNMFGYIGGHALGFCKINDTYHFMDSNSGWFRFKDAEDFKNWLPFYFKLIGYDKWFGEYAMNTYSLSLEAQSEAQPDSKPKIGVAAAIALVIASPLILLYVAGSVFNFFVIRGFRYLYSAIKNGLSPEEPCLENEASDEHLLTLNESLTSESLPKSLEFLDLAVKTPEEVGKKPAQTSAKALNGILDLPIKDLASIEERAARNEEFKQARGNSFFKENKDKAENSKKPVISRRSSF